MVIRIGLDLTEISRTQHALDSSPRFAERILGRQEREWLEQNGFRTESVAASFAAKEAFSKAMGTGIRGFALSEVEVLRNELGKPYYVFSGKAKELVEESGLTFDLSLTHTDTTAAAVAVAYREDDTIDHSDIG